MWAITSEERTKHDKQFDNLKPSGGYITGLYLIFVILFIINVFLGETLLLQSSRFFIYKPYSENPGRGIGFCVLGVLSKYTYKYGEPIGDVSLALGSYSYTTCSG